MFVCTWQRLNQDICNLSTLCSQSRQLKKQRQLQQQEYDNYNQNEPELVKTISRDELLTSLRRWQESGHLPEPEIIAHIVAACNEVIVSWNKFVNCPWLLGGLLSGPKLCRVWSNFYFTSIFVNKSICPPHMTSLNYEKLNGEWIFSVRVRPMVSSSSE